MNEQLQAYIIYLNFLSDLYRMKLQIINEDKTLSSQEKIALIHQSISEFNTHFDRLMKQKIELESE